MRNFHVDGAGKQETCQVEGLKNVISSKKVSRGTNPWVVHAKRFSSMLRSIYSTGLDHS